MSYIRIEDVGGQSLDRINKLLAGIPGGAIKAAYSALKRAGDTAKTQAGRFAAAEYTINKGDFMRNTTIKTKTSATSAGVASMSISYAGNVLPLLTFNTSYSRDGAVRTQVKRNGSAQLLEHVFVAKISGHTGTYERVGSARFPLEQKFGPSTGRAHPDDCPYCAARGWKTFPGTSFEAECDKWAAEHPEEAAEAGKEK